MNTLLQTEKDSQQTLFQHFVAARRGSRYSPTVRIPQNTA
jgi:hypothetical protein